MSQKRPTVCFAGTRLEALKSVQRFADVTSIITAPGSWVHTQLQPGGPKLELVDKNRKDAAFRFPEAQSIDLVITAGFSLIIPPSVLQSGPAFLNSHPSLFPVHGGYHPIKQAFDNREECMGVSVHQMVEKVDAGPVIHQERVWIKDLKLLRSYDHFFSVVAPMAITRSLEQVLQRGVE